MKCAVKFSGTWGDLQKNYTSQSEPEEMTIASDTESIRSSSTADSIVIKKGTQCAAKKSCKIKNRHFRIGENCFVLPCGCVFHMNCLWIMYINLI